MRSSAAGVRDGVLEQRVQRDRQPVAVDQDGRLGRGGQPPPAGRVAPPVERVDRHRVERDRLEVQEVRAARRGQQQHPGGQPPQPHQLVGDHVGVLGDLLVGDRALDQLRVAERHRDRRAKLVGGVLQEPPLLFQQPQVLLRDPLHLFHRRQPPLDRRQPPAAVPDHHQEHQRDQRDLGQVVRVLLALEDLRPR